jgi:predicted nucleic-acid-binding protein
MVYLIDANVIIRFLVQEENELYTKSVQILQDVEKGKLKIEILNEVVMEVIFIMTKYYKVPLPDIVNDLKALLLLEGVVNKDKYIVIDTLMLMQYKKIDFVDALICSKSKLQGYGKINFDNDVMKKCEK